MPLPTTHYGAQIFHGPVTFGDRVYLPAESVDDDHVSSDDAKRISSEKVVHRIDLNYRQADGSDVVSATELLRVLRGAGTLLSAEVRPTTAPTGGDKQFTVDIQKAADGSNSWTSLLDAAEVVDSTSVNHTNQVVTLAADATIDAGDAVRVVVTASGSTGSQGQGFVVSAAVAEEPS